MSASPTQRPAQILTLVVWSTCACIGVLGLWLHHPWPQAPVKIAEPMTAQVAVELPPPELKLEVPPPPAPELAPKEITLHPATTAVASTPPPPLAQVALPNAPTVTPVAAPSAAIAFAVPVAGPTRIVAQVDAAAGPTSGSPKGSTKGVPGGVAGSTGTTVGAAPAPKQLVFGQGEGRQDKPTYPREALKRKQEGSVGIRFIVDETGSVSEAEIAEPCPYPLLNLAALEVVKKSWRFPSGDKRLYQVSIRFQMSRD